MATSYSKAQFVLAALTELGIATRGYQMTPDELLDGATALDNMMADWDAQGLHIGYPITASPSEVTTSTPTQVPAWANRAVIANLALELGPQYGKQPMMPTLVRAKQGLNTVRANRDPPPSMQPSLDTPAGAGNRPWTMNGNPFLAPPVDAIDVNSDSELDFD